MRRTADTLRPGPPEIVNPGDALGGCGVLTTHLRGHVRHHGMKLLPHLISAAVVTVLLLWTITRAVSQYGELGPIRRPAVMLLAL